MSIIIPCINLKPIVFKKFKFCLKERFFCMYKIFVMLALVSFSLLGMEDFQRQAGQSLTIDVSSQDVSSQKVCQSKMSACSEMSGCTSICTHCSSASSLELEQELFTYDQVIQIMEPIVLDLKEEKCIKDKEFKQLKAEKKELSEENCSLKRNFDRMHQLLRESDQKKSFFEILCKKLFEKNKQLQIEKKHLEIENQVLQNQADASMILYVLADVESPCKKKRSN